MDGVVACTAARRLSEDPYGCSSSACSSPDGQGGSDCYAGPFDEACSCSSGAAYPVGTMEWEGQTYTQYTCCTAESGLPTQGSACDFSKKGETVWTPGTLRAAGIAITTTSGSNAGPVSGNPLDASWKPREASWKPLGASGRPLEASRKPLQKPLESLSTHLGLTLV